jgi:hypothetical protein
MIIFQLLLTSDSVSVEEEKLHEKKTKNLNCRSVTSPVILPAPISPVPSLTIVIFFTWDSGAATSAATCRIN